MSLEQLADQAGASTGTIHRLETGATHLYHELLPELSRILGCPAWQLAGFDGPKDDACGGNDLHQIDETPQRDLIQKPDVTLTKFRQTELLLPAQVWKVHRNTLDAIGVVSGDLIAVIDIGSQAPEMGDPVLIKISTGEDEVADPKKALLRQYIEPDLFITNSKGGNEPTINRVQQKVVLIGTVSNKIFRPGVRNIT